MGPDSRTTADHPPVAKTFDDIGAGVLLGTCLLEELVGEGGMAVVYRARQTLMNRTVAVKVLKPKVISNPSALAGFLKEAMASGKLTHPSVAHVYYTAEENGIHYLVMEYVDGTDLKKMLRDRTFAPKKALEIVRQLADVLAYAHDRGIVHRDIKPGNIMIRRSGDIVLTDFGIASTLGDDDNRLACGTPGYMSPEQIRGRRVDERSDLYSLGATLFALLCGHPPFVGRDPRAVAQTVLTQPAPPLRSAPKAVTKLCERLLAKAPEDRYQSTRDIIAVVDKILASRGERVSSGMGLPEIGLGPKTVWPFGTTATVAGAAVLCVAIIGLFLVTRRRADASITVDAAGAPTVQYAAERFGEALVNREVSGLRALMEPSLLQKPEVQRSITSLVQAAQALPPDSSVRTAVISESGDRAEVLIMYGSGSSASLRVITPWARGDLDSGWFLVPQGPTYEIPFSAIR